MSTESQPRRRSPVHTADRLRLRLVRSAQERALVYAVRIRVFHEEQAIPLEEEFDSDDFRATHVLAFARDRAVGTARLLEPALALKDGPEEPACATHPQAPPVGWARIGRLAVLREYRRQGIGAALVRRLLREGRRRGQRQFVLNAQVQAIPFYERLGFAAEGDVFLEADIPHRVMYWQAKPSP